MEDVLALIERLIREHRVIKERVEAAEKFANDASLVKDLDAARDAFVPGRFEQGESLLELAKSLEKIEKWIDGHFNREETALLKAIEKQEERRFVAALKSLLLEHEDLRNRLSHSRNHVAELVSGGLARHKWNASAHDMRAHLSHTRKLLEVHASMENELFVDLRRYLKEKIRKG